MTRPILRETSMVNKLGCLKANKSPSIVRKPKDVHRLMESLMMKGMKSKASAVNTSYGSLTLSHE